MRRAAFTLLALAATALAAPATPAAPLTGTFDGADAQRSRLPVVLEVVASVPQPTDIQALPGHAALVVLSKNGRVWRVNPATGATRQLFALDVLTRSEQGLLGLAFHPDYRRNRRFYLNYSTRDAAGRPVTRVEAWQGDLASDVAPKATHVVIEVAQPWPNHNAGQIAFGPDGTLYLGLGDGGAADDPRGHGQNRATLLGAMLRLDVDAVPYAVPADNPFVGQPGVRPEIWAYGLRNPWRFSFAPDGRLVVGDVGQNRFEEITVVGRGENHGWNTREAGHCFPPGRACTAAGMIDPIYSYPHAEGYSITGGYVASGLGAPALKGKYVFGDFGSGRLWAFDLPTAGAKVARVHALGRFAVLPSTFGLGGDGALYVGDFGGGRVLRVRAP